MTMFKLVPKLTPKIEINDILEFNNNNSGFTLKGKVRGIFRTSRFNIGVCLEGHKSTEVSWFSIEDISIISINGKLYQTE